MSDAPDSDFVTWVLAGIVAVVGALSSTVGWLWKVNETRNAKRIDQLEEDLVVSNTKHDECMTDRNALREECAGMRVRLEMVEESIKKK